MAIVLAPTDDVAVLKRTIKAGEELRNGSTQLRTASAITAGHKIALREIPEGAPVRKYGQIIGFAQRRIAPGEHVHVHHGVPAHVQGSIDLVRPHGTVTIVALYEEKALIDPMVLLHKEATIVAGAIERPWQLPMPGASTWLAVLGLAALSTALAYIVFFQVLRRSGPTNVMLVTLLVPVTAILLGSLVLGEQISLREIVGALVIGSALLLIDGRVLKFFGR